MSLKDLFRHTKLHWTFNESISPWATFAGFTTTSRTIQRTTRRTATIDTLVGLVRRGEEGQFEFVCIWFDCIKFDPNGSMIRILYYKMMLLHSICIFLGFASSRNWISVWLSLVWSFSVSFSISFQWTRRWTQKRWRPERCETVQRFHLWPGGIRRGCCFRRKWIRRPRPTDNYQQ